MIETVGIGTLIVIGAMFLVTLATRLGGVFVMSYIPISYRVKQFIKEVEQLKKEKDYDEFVMKAENRLASWNRILNKPTQIGIVSSTF
jgi:hypothetical protein